MKAEYIFVFRYFGMCWVNGNFSIFCILQRLAQVGLGAAVSPHFVAAIDGEFCVLWLLSDLY